MTDQFEELLKALGHVFHLPLHIDKHHACSIQVHNQLIIQLKPDPSLENLFIFSKIIEIPPGKFRENVLREALKANASTDPRVGIFGYIASTNQLALFQRYPFGILNGERLAGLVGAFLEYCETWRKAIEGGFPAPPSSSSTLPPPMGLKP